MMTEIFKGWLAREIGLLLQSPWDCFAKALDVSESTVRRAAGSMGLHKRNCRKKPFLSEKASSARRTWAAANVDQDWRDWSSQTNVPSR
jgi:hypothetical protein